MFSSVRLRTKRYHTTMQPPGSCPEAGQVQLQPCQLQTKGRQPEAQPTASRRLRRRANTCKVAYYQRTCAFYATHCWRETRATAEKTQSKDSQLLGEAAELMGRASWVELRPTRWKTYGRVCWIWVYLAPFDGHYPDGFC